MRPIRSWLYAPGNNAKLLDRVFTAGADAVILDLEDAVPPAEKERARAMVAEAVAGREAVDGPAVFVRVNHPDTGLTEAEIRTVVRPGLDGLRLPKVESADTVRLVDTWIADAERSSGRPVGSVGLVCNVESAAGIWAARDIASASRRVLTLAFGTADFLRDVNGTLGPDAVETLYARSYLVLATRVAGVQPPIDGVYPRLDDDEGLDRTTRQSRGLGFFGRSTLHPRQVPIVNAAFTPSDAEVDAARRVIDAAQQAEATGSGALRLPGGDFVDVAIVRRAEATLRLAAALAKQPAGR